MNNTSVTDTASHASAKERFVTPAYLWFDAEFTDLDVASARLLQVAMVATDTRLRPLAPPDHDINLVIRLDAGAQVSAWVETNLAALLARSRAPAAVPVCEADRLLAQRVDSLLGPPADKISLRPVLAGNTVHMDAALIRRHLPEFHRRLHYRMLDVSTLKTVWNDSGAGPDFDKADANLIRRFLPAGFCAPDGGEHDAYADVYASLAEMNYYLGKLGWGRTSDSP